MMATIREWLTKSCFDFVGGRIIVHAPGGWLCEDEDKFREMARALSSPKED